MLELNCSYTFSHVPYILNEVLDEYAEKVIADAALQNLHCPVPVDVDAFVEFYLGLHVEYKRLSYSRKVLGLTAFNEGYVQVYDDNTAQPVPLYVQAGTVIVDTSLLQKRNESRLRFTLMHEASHWLLHQKAISAENIFFSNEKYDNQYLAAKEGRIDYSRLQSERNDSERMERQADFLASALLMPRPAMRVAYRKYFDYYSQRPTRIVRGTGFWHDSHAVQLPQYIAKLFNVSKRAALIRLEKLNAIVDQSSLWSK